MESYPPLRSTDSFKSSPTLNGSVAEMRLARRLELALGYRILGNFGWGASGDGHISARDPERLDHFWLARYGVAFSQMTVNDIVLVGPDGSVVDAPGGIDTGINEAAYLIHWPLHEARPDIISAVHTHTGWGTPFSAQRRLIRPISQEACAFFEDHVVFDDDELNIVTLAGGQRIGKAIGSMRCAVLANHGLLTTGKTIAEAVGWFVTMERVAEVEMKAGDSAKPISAEAARRVRESVGPCDVGWHAFEWLVRKYLPDASVIGVPNG